MIIKLDENLGRPHVALLKRHGHDADRVFDQNLSGVVDAELWVHVKRERRFLILLIWDSQTFAATFRAHIQEYCFYAHAEKGETQYPRSCDVL